MRIIDHTIAPAAPVQPVAPAPALRGGPPMPWSVREAEGYGGRVFRHKVYPGNIYGDVLLPEDEQWLALVAYLEARVTTLQNENEALRTSLAVFAASEPVAVEELVSPLPPEIEAAVVQEVAVSLSAEARAAWAEGLIDRLPRRVPLAVEPEPGVVPPADGCQQPDGFVELVPELASTTSPTPEPLAQPTAPPTAREVGAHEQVAEVGVEPAAQKTPRRLAVEAALMAAPQLSNAAIGEQCEVSDEYARRVRKMMEAAGQLDVVTKTADAA